MHLGPGDGAERLRLGGPERGAGREADPQAGQRRQVGEAGECPHHRRHRREVSDPLVDQGGRQRRRQRRRGDHQRRAGEQQRHQARADPVGVGERDRRQRDVVDADAHRPHDLDGVGGERPGTDGDRPRRAGRARGELEQRRRARDRHRLAGVGRQGNRVVAEGGGAVGHPGAAGDDQGGADRVGAAPQLVAGSGGVDQRHCEAGEPEADEGGEQLGGVRQRQDRDATGGAGTPRALGEGQCRGGQGAAIGAGAGGRAHRRRVGAVLGEGEEAACQRAAAVTHACSAGARASSPRWRGRAAGRSARAPP